MEKCGNNYKVSTLGDRASLNRIELHDILKLTGTEISINELPAGASVPFVHAHTNNEEAYIILEGKYIVFIDGDEFVIAKEDVLRIDPKAQRCFKADAHSALRYICIQVKANSLGHFTQEDAILCDVKPSWF